MLMYQICVNTGQWIIGLKLRHIHEIELSLVRIKFSYNLVEVQLVNLSINPLVPKIRLAMGIL